MHLHTRGPLVGAWWISEDGEQINVENVDKGSPNVSHSSRN